MTTTDEGGSTHSRPLDARLDLCHHSKEFEWGRDGSGAAQLALAILADHLGDSELALELHQRFKLTTVALLPQRAWALDNDAVAQAVRRLRP